MSKGNQGALLLESLIVVEILIVAFAAGYITSIRSWNRSLGELQEERLTYDGERP